MTRLPTPGSDSGQWGDLLNEFLSQAHTADGKLKTDSVSAAQLAPGSVQSSTIANGVVTNAKLDDGTRASLAKADSSLQAVNNLSDVTDPAAARSAIGAGTSSLILGTTAGTAAAGDDSRIAGAAQKSSNLSDLANAATARGNLGAQMRGVYDARDYGTTGTGAAIQAALSAATAAGGGTVYVHGGTWTLTATLTIGNNTHLMLAPNATILRGADINAMLINAADGTTGGFAAAQNVTVSGGVWNGNGGVWATASTLIGFGHIADVNIHDTKLTNTHTWHCLEINAGTRVTVDRVIFDGIVNGASTELMQIDSASGSGAFPWFGPYDGTECSGVQVTRCTFSNGGGQDSAGVGTHNEPAVAHSKILIEDCSFGAGLAQGVKMFKWKDVQIVRCRFTDAAMVSGVRAYGPGSNNVDIIGCLIDGPCYGVNVDNATTNSARWMIAQNTFRNIGLSFTSLARAVRFSGGGASNRIYSDITITGNSLFGSGRHGFGADYATNLTISNNRIDGCATSAIWTYAVLRGLISGNVITGTTSRNDILVGISGGDAAVTADVVVSGNTATDYIDVFASTRTVVVGNSYGASTVTRPADCIQAGNTDTGWRNIATLLIASNAEVHGTGGYVRIKRVDNRVQLDFRLQPTTAKVGTTRADRLQLLTLPAGFLIRNVARSLGSASINVASTATYYPAAVLDDSADQRIDLIGMGTAGNWGAGDVIIGSVSWLTDDVKPASLPGTAG